MSNSLKDQLLALGLAPKKTEPRPKKQGKPQRKPGSKPGSETSRRKNDSAEISLDQAYRIRSKDDRQQKEQAIARKREQERQRREVNQKILALVKESEIRDVSADCKRNFLYKGKIRSALVTREQIEEINNGAIAVVYLSGNYHLMPADKIEEIRQFAPDHIPDLSGAETEGEEDNPVPDDLIW
jgi:uncharacterized protein YaiL (DUF2058 family)